MPEASWHHVAHHPKLTRHILTLFFVPPTLGTASNILFGFNYTDGLGISCWMDETCTAAACKCLANPMRPIAGSDYVPKW